ncbi:hypothetical protein LIA77_01419 [Sarocladium implicatum]|nr:hypothetical protein LIA77_01419 [Sarocladium implicatum]
MTTTRLLYAHLGYELVATGLVNIENEEEQAELFAMKEDTKWQNRVTRIKADEITKSEAGSRGRELRIKMLKTWLFEINTTSSYLVQVLMPSGHSRQGVIANAGKLQDMRATERLPHGSRRLVLLAGQWS